MQPTPVENIAGQRMLRLTRSQTFRLETFPFWTIVSENAKALFVALTICLFVGVPVGVANYKLSMANACFKQGLKLYYQKRYDEAIQQYQQAIHFLPKYSGSYDNWGLCLYKQGHTDLAITKYRQALVLDPNNSHACSNLGKALFLQGNRTTGLAELWEAVRVNPNDGRSHTMLGSALYRSGDKGQARQQWQKAMRLGDQEADDDLQKFSDGPTAFTKVSPGLKTERSRSTIAAFPFL